MQILSCGDIKSQVFYPLQRGLFEDAVSQLGGMAISKRRETKDGRTSAARGHLRLRGDDDHRNLTGGGGLLSGRLIAESIMSDHCLFSNETLADQFEFACELHE